MTREKSNELKVVLIERVKSGNWDRKTYDLLNQFCKNAHIYKLGCLNRSIEAYSTAEAKEVRKELQVYITERIAIWALPKRMTCNERAAVNPDDVRKINYELSGIIDGEHQTVEFTSENEVDGLMMCRIKNAVIKEINLIDNEWFIKLAYN